jgi:RecA-family ATPase
MRPTEHRKLINCEHEFINPNFSEHDEIFNSKITPEMILKETNDLITRPENNTETKSLFLIKGANHWIEQAKKRPIPNMLFGEFWFQGELCILFADTNLGKSILAVQIADSISRGNPILNFMLQASGEPVLYFDFELSDKQFENRYSTNFSDHFAFDDKLLRVEIDPEGSIPSKLSFEDYLINSLERSITETTARVLIIDNLTYLKNDTEKAKDALPLMKKLKELKNKYGLSIMALAHTPKRDLTKPISKNDLAGSKMLINFCDSAFTIGESHADSQLRYLKQIKARNTEIIYDSENICVCQIRKHNSFLQFEFINYGTESEHLKERTEKDNSELIEKIKELASRGRSYREIGSQLGISHAKVGRLLKAA